MNIIQVIQDKLRVALKPLVAGVEPFAVMVRATQDAKHGDYQANCAMSLAKALGKKPRDVAQEIADRLDLGEELQKPEVAGPGFINLRLQPAWMAKQIQSMARDDRLGVAQAQPAKIYVIDFSSPNVAKPMHVGHLRSTIIGDSLSRLLQFLGHTVISDNHLGDWGTQFGILLYGYRNFRDDQALRADPVRELARLYLHVRGLMKSDEDDEGKKTADPVADAARLETAKLHAGDLENLRLWQMFMPACLEEIDRIYRRLDVHFDHTYGESFYNPMLPGVVADLEQKGIAHRSDGALIIPFGDYQSPAMIQKKDGAFTYTTTDIATIKHRLDTWHPDAILYVVDSRQALHFKNLFAAARRCGFGQIHLEHIAFGSVLGEDRRPLKTRDGGAVELESLLDEAVVRAGQVYEGVTPHPQPRVPEVPGERGGTHSQVGSVTEGGEGGEDAPELSADERRQIDEAIGIGAVKYADLCQNRLTDYIFSWPKMLAMNGNTAAYMQYAYVRNRGIFRKGGVDVAKYRTQPPLPILDTDHERALALQLLRFEDTLHAAAAEYQPSVITAYLWDLAKAYSGFFQNSPVLKAEPHLRESRLLLCDLTGRVIQKCLSLLGIRTVERM